MDSITDAVPSYQVSETSQASAADAEKKADGAVATSSAKARAKRATRYAVDVD